MQESTRLMNVCPADFRQIVTAALLTGCRYGELAAMQCSDFNPDAGAVLVRVSKSGTPRHVPLNDEGQRFFKRVALGRSGADRLFVKTDGASHTNLVRSRKPA